MFQIHDSRIPIGERLMGQCLSAAKRRAATQEGDRRSREAGALILNMHSRPNKSEARRGTRIKQEIPVLVTNSDPAHPFSEPGLTLLVNPQGCAIRLGHPLAVGTAVRLQQLPGGRGAGARVVNCIQIDDYKQFWLLGLALDEPGNVWGIEIPPEDWSLGT